MPLKREDLAKNMVLAGLGAFIDPTGLLLPAAVEAGSKLLPARSHEEELERICRAVKKLRRGNIPREGYDTASGLLKAHFRGTRDLYAFDEDPGALADELIRRSGKRLTTGVRGYTRQCLLAFFSACRDLPAEVQALERIFRLDVRERLEELHSLGTADRAALAHLERWVRAAVLHDPRESFDQRRTQFDDLGPARLLDARAETVPFFGREAELAELEAWLEDETDFDAWIFAAPGGIGKTRLLLATLDRARRLGWRAGFLKSGLDRRDVEAAAETMLRDAQPIFAVIDYAEDRPSLTAALLYPWLVAGGTPRRLVLLCRRHDLLHDALDRHRRDRDAPRDAARDAARDAHSYLAGAKVRRLEQDALVLPVARRREAFTEAQAAFLNAGAGQKYTAPHPVDDLSDEFFDGRLFGRSLYLHIAAYTSLFGPPKVQRSDLLGFVLDREFDHLERLCQGQKQQALQELTDDNLRPVLALTTLALAARSDVGAAPGVPAIQVFLESGGLGEFSAPARNALVGLLARTYPHPLGGGDRMDALRPDPLGEALVFAAVNARPALLDAAFVPLLDAAAYDSAATVLYRTALAFAPDDTGEAWLEERLEQAGVLERGVVVDAFLRQIPITTTGFARFTATLGEGRAVHTRARLDAAPEDEAAMRAHAVAADNLGIRRSGLGRREEALEATEEAVEIYRRLAERNPDAFLPDLANAFWTLGLVQVDHAPADAAAACAEGIRLLTPYFTRLPAAHARVIGGLLQTYLQACTAAERAPDEDLLTPLLPFCQPPDEGADS